LLFLAINRWGVEGTNQGKENQEAVFHGREAFVKWGQIWELLPA
jgi:hypothetical protein